MTAAGAFSAAAQSLKMPAVAAAPSVAATPCTTDFAALEHADDNGLDRGGERTRVTSFCTAGLFARPLYGSLAAAGVPPSVREELIEAFGATIDLVRDVAEGDGFHVRYEQAMQGDRAVGTGRLLWSEVQSRTKGTVAVHRFRSNDGAERFWTASGKAAVPPVMRLPLAQATVSSGFGMRRDPFAEPTSKFLGMGGPQPQQPDRTEASLAPEVPAAAPAPEATKEEPTKKKRRLSSLSFSGFSSSSGEFANGERNAREIVIETAAAAPEKPKEDAKPEEKPGPRLTKLFMHSGVDLVAPAGTPIFASGDGVVAGAGPNGPYGNWIRIDHPGRVTTIYGHLSAYGPGIVAGAEVKEGQLIGLVGSTGRSTGAHLHFEVWRNGQAVDPLAVSEMKPPVLGSHELQRFRAQVGKSLGQRGQELAGNSLPQ